MFKLLSDLILLLVLLVKITNVSIYYIFIVPNHYCIMFKISLSNYSKMLVTWHIFLAHLAKGIVPVVAMFVNGSGQNDQSL
jgi:hypothetical protein